MNFQHLPHFVSLIVLTVSSAKTLYSDEDFGDLDLLKNNDLNSLSDSIGATTCPGQRPIDCADVFKNGNKYSGLYTIYPNHRIIPCEKLEVYCDMQTDGGGWTVIQRRGNFKRSNDYFYKTWAEYKKGFGNLKEDFWLGNDYIYVLSNQKKTSIRFDLKTVRGETAYALYDTFWIEDESARYRLQIDDYSGSAGDSMSYHNNMFFSTKDRKYDKSNGTGCAQTFKGGWWYNSCLHSNLNGVHFKGPYPGDKAIGVVWKAFKGFNDSLATVEMKIRPINY